MGLFTSGAASRLMPVAALLAGGLGCLSAMAGSYTQLHGFTGASDGAVPGSGLTADSSGNLYGTTSEGALICNGNIYDETAA